MWLTLIMFFALFGLVIGSFLNVVVLRLEADKTLDGRSKCPSCGTTIRWYDNVPVLSFFLLGRRCRVCHFPVSWQYPAVELLTGILFAVFGMFAFGDGTTVEIVRVLWLLFLISLMVVIAVYDARNMEIPLVLLLVGVVGAFGYALLTTGLSSVNWLDPAAPWREMLWGGVFAAAIFYALVYFSKETWMGMGDVWLAGVVGAAAGFSALLLLLTLSFFTGAVVGSVLLFTGKRGMKSQVPFAPFLAAGTLTTLLLQLIQPWWLTFLLIPSVWFGVV
ncbi:MAG: prepilin peptidase [Candidatus Moraniibacteriota bacterium]